MAAASDAAQRPGRPRQCVRLHAGGGRQVREQRPASQHMRCGRWRRSAAAGRHSRERASRWLAVPAAGYSQKAIVRRRGGRSGRGRRRSASPMARRRRPFRPAHPAGSSAGDHHRWVLHAYHGASAVTPTNPAGCRTVRLGGDIDADRDHDRIAAQGHGPASALCNRARRVKRDLSSWQVGSVNNRSDQLLQLSLGGHCQRMAWTLQALVDAQCAREMTLGVSSITLINQHSRQTVECLSSPHVDGT